MFDQYIERWNIEEPLDEWNIQKRGIKTKHDFKLYNQLFAVKTFAKKAEMTVNPEEDTLSFSWPVTVASNTMVDGLPYYSFSDTLEVQIKIADSDFGEADRESAANVGRELPDREFRI